LLAGSDVTHLAVDDDRLEPPAREGFPPDDYRGARKPVAREHSRRLARHLRVEHGKVLGDRFQPTVAAGALEAAGEPWHPVIVHQKIQLGRRVFTRTRRSEYGSGQEHANAFTLPCPGGLACRLSPIRFVTV